MLLRWLLHHLHNSLSKGKKRRKTLAKLLSVRKSKFAAAFKLAALHPGRPLDAENS